MPAEATDRASASATALGILALVLWSTTFGVARTIAEDVGVVAGPACIYLAAGVLSTAVMLARRGGFARVRSLPPRYLYGCGAIFLAYMVCIYLAVGLPPRRPQVLETGLINYLWPGLTLVLSVPLLGMRARPWLAPGMAAAFAGVVLAVSQGGGVSWGGFVGNLCESPAPYVAALGAAVTWALYSNLSRRWARDAQGSAVPLFLLATGVAFAALVPVFPFRPVWSTRVLVEIAYVAVFPATLAYTFWDSAMRRGRMVLVASLSYVTPLTATIVSCLYLGVRPSWTLWLACALVIGGAVVCKLSVVEPSGPPAPPAPPEALARTEATG